MTFTRSQCLRGQRCLPQTAAQAIDCLAHHSERTLEEMAAIVDRPIGYLRKATSPNDDTHSFRFELAVALTMASGRTPQTRNYAALNFFARTAAAVVFFVPEIGDGVDNEIILAHLDAVKESGDVAAKLIAILPNGISERERDEAHVEIDEAIARYAALKAKIDLAVRPEVTR